MLGVLLLGRLTRGEALRNDPVLGRLTEGPLKLGLRTLDRLDEDGARLGVPTLERLNEDLALERLKEDLPLDRLMDDGALKLFRLGALTLGPRELDRPAEWDLDGADRWPADLDGPREPDEWPRDDPLGGFAAAGPTASTVMSPRTTHPSTIRRTSAVGPRLG